MPYNAERMVTSFKEKMGNKYYPLQIADVGVTSEGTARVLVAVGSSSFLEASKADRFEALSSLFKGHCTPIPYSWRVLEGAGVPTIVGYVSSPVKTRTIKDTSGMQELSKNLYLDPEDESLWNVCSEGGNMYLSHDVEDLSETLEASSVDHAPRLSQVAVMAAVDSQDTAGSEYVAYVSPTTQKVRYGFVVASGNEFVEIVPHVDVTDDSGHTDPVEAVPPDLLFHRMSIPSNDIPLPVRIPQGKEHQIVYYKRVYGYDPAFLKQFEDQIRSDAVV